jgi:HEPN domain-containing protein
VLHGSDIEVRRFLRVALQRLDEANFLFAHGYNTAAVYLAGYAVECALKALLLSVTPPSRRAAVLHTFRGRHGHDLAGLATDVVAALLGRRKDRRGPADFPARVRQWLARTNSWTTDIRYNPRSVPAEDAREFLAAAEGLTRWVTGG